MPSLACIHAKLRRTWVSHIDQILSGDLQAISINTYLFLSQELRNNYLVEKDYLCLQLLKKPSCINSTETHRNGFPDEETSPPPWASFQTLAMIWDPLPWASNSKHLAREIAKCGPFQAGACTRAALQSCERCAFAPESGFFRGSWEQGCLFNGNVPVSEPSPLYAVRLCLWTNGSTWIKCQFGLKIPCNDPQQNTFSYIFYSTRPPSATFMTKNSDTIRDRVSFSE